jgi:hypothetical protein
MYVRRKRSAWEPRVCRGDNVFDSLSPESCWTGEPKVRRKKVKKKTKKEKDYLLTWPFKTISHDQLIMRNDVETIH